MRTPTLGRDPLAARHLRSVTAVASPADATRPTGAVETTATNAIPAPATPGASTSPAAPEPTNTRHRTNTEVDPFGRDASGSRFIQTAIDLLATHYLGLQTHGLEHIADGQPLILVANHNGLVPFDALLVGQILGRKRGLRVRPLIEDYWCELAFIGPLLRRLGAVRVCAENAERLLALGESILAFPEGMRGYAKPLRSAIAIDLFGHGGIIKIAQRSGAPIVPVAISGLEQCYPVLAKITRTARKLGLPFLALTPTFPWLGPLGLVPLPTQCVVTFGQPLAIDPTSDVLAANATLVARIEALLAREPGESVVGE